MPGTVLVLPLEAKGGAATPETCDLLTGTLSLEVARVTGARVRSIKEVQAAMSQEQLRMTANCDEAGCIAEIAGALNVDEVVMGQFGAIGDAYVMNLARVRAGDAEVAGRAQIQFTGNASTVLGRIPGAVNDLYASRAATSAAAPAPSNEAPRRGVSPLVVAGLGGAAVAGLGTLAAFAVAASVAVVPAVVFVPLPTRLFGAPRAAVFLGGAALAVVAGAVMAATSAGLAALAGLEATKGE